MLRLIEQIYNNSGLSDPLELHKIRFFELAAGIGKRDGEAAAADEGISNITSFMIASQMERKPRAPSLNSNALSTI